MSWVTETHERQEAAKADRTRRDQVLTELSDLFMGELRTDSRAHVKEINQVYTDKFGGKLCLVESEQSGIEVRCGLNPVLTATHLPVSHVLRVVRYRPVGRLGKFNRIEDYYSLKLDSQENLYLESKNGDPVPPDTAAQELLGFLLED